MALTGPIDGGPTRHPLSIIDTLTAAHATSAICAALTGPGSSRARRLHRPLPARHRHRRAGQHRDAVPDDGQVPERSGNRHIVGGTDRPVRDGHRARSTGDGDRPALLAEFCQFIERPDLIDDERFATPGGRSRNRDALEVEIEQALKRRPASEWLAQMDHLPAGGVRTSMWRWRRPEVLERGRWCATCPTATDEIALLGTPFKFADAELPEFRTPPLLGEHTDDILGSVVGLNADEIAALRRDRVVV